MNRLIVSITSLLIGSQVAFAAVTEWSGRTLNTDYSITGGSDVVILGRWHCRTLKTVRVPLFCEQCLGWEKDCANGA